MHFRGCLKDLSPQKLNNFENLILIGATCWVIFWQVSWTIWGLWITHRQANLYNIMFLFVCLFVFCLFVFVCLFFVCLFVFVLSWLTARSILMSRILGGVWGGCAPQMLIFFFFLIWYLMYQDVGRLFCCHLIPLITSRARYWLT